MNEKWSVAARTVRRISADGDEVAVGSVAHDEAACAALGYTTSEAWERVVVVDFLPGQGSWQAANGDICEAH